MNSDIRNEMDRYREIKEHVSEVIDLSEEEMAEFQSILSPTEVLRKQFLIRPGDTVNMEYYVVKGCLIAYYLDSSGEKHIIQFAIEDWWISDFEAFFGDRPAKLYIEAIEDTFLLGIHGEILETLYHRIPKFERFFRIKTTHTFVALRKRILSSLEKNATERYKEFCLNYPGIADRVNNYHIANYLGIKPESLSRIRRKLETVS